MKMNQWMMVAGLAAVMSLGMSQVTAQPNDSGNRKGPGGPPSGGFGRGNFDPAQMEQRILQNYKENLEVTNDDEWKAIEPRVKKVMEARRDSFSGMARGMFGRSRRSGDSQSNDSRSRGSMFGGAPNPAADALQKAIDSKASKSELKAALEKYVAVRKEKQAELEKAQASLRELLTPRQEAIATLNGLL